MTSLMTCVEGARDWKSDREKQPPWWNINCGGPAVKRLLSGVNVGRNVWVRVKSFSPAS